MGGNPVQDVRHVTRRVADNTDMFNFITKIYRHVANFDRIAQLCNINKSLVRRIRNDKYLII